jgi:hypothetical protein
MKRKEVYARVKLLSAQGGTVPDWVELGTVRKFVKNWPSFKGRFKGVGWYFVKDDALLIVPGGVGTLKTGDVGKPIFAFMCFNYRDPRIVFRAVADAPVKFDARRSQSRTMRFGRIE